MSRQRYPEEFKIEAVKQVTEKGKTVADVAQRLGMSVHSLYAWIKLYSKPQEQRQQDDEQQAELRKLRAELKRVTEERDILKKAAAYFAKECNLHQEALDGSPGAAPMPNPKGASQRLLRLADRASICPSKRRSSSAWLDQTCLARKRRCVRLPQNS